MEKSDHPGFHSYDRQEEGKSDGWKWKDLHLKFTILTSPLPLYFIIIGLLQNDYCDSLLSIWCVLIGVLMAIELIYLSVYRQRKALETKSELDLDDSIFEHYENNANQNVKDPILRKAIKLHLNIGIVSFIGLAKCFLILSWSDYCSAYLFWPSLMISSMYCISLVLFGCFTLYKTRSQRNQNMLV